MRWIILTNITQVFARRGVYGVAIANIIVLTAKNMCFLPVYTALIIEQAVAYIHKICCIWARAFGDFALSKLCRQTVRPTWDMVTVSLDLHGTGAGWNRSSMVRILKAGSASDY